jgi:uncharacterized protein with beta-barrel porin domain
MDRMESATRATRMRCSGAQNRIGDGWFFGGSVAYDTTSFDGSDGEGSVNGHGPQVGVVLKKEIGNLTISGGADAGYGLYDTARNVDLPGYAAAADGDFQTSEVSLHSRVAFTIPEDNWYMKPLWTFISFTFTRGAMSNRAPARWTSQ